jgi:hypothetical protein
MNSIQKKMRMMLCIILEYNEKVTLDYSEYGRHLQKLIDQATAV